MSEVCENCGNAIEPSEDFCGQCGNYLNWEERAPTVVAAAASDVPAAAPEEAAPKTFGERVKAAVGIGSGAEQTAESPPADPVAGPSEAATTEKAGDQPGQAAVATPVLPGAAAPPPKARKPPPVKERVDPGDLICGNCGVGNRPIRKFCRRCGHDITEAEVAKLPWHRRLFRRTPKAGPVAGTRPTARKRRRAPRRMVALLVTLGIVGAAFVLIRPHSGGLWQWTLDTVKRTEEVLPAQTRGTTGRPDHGVRKTIDDGTNTYWWPVGNGDGAEIRYPMKEPIRLVMLRIYPGASAENNKQFLATGRPREIVATFVTSDDKEHQETLEFPNTMGPRDFEIRLSDVEQVRLTIQRVWVSKSRNGVALAEVEFHARK